MRKVYWVWITMAIGLVLSNWACDEAEESSDTVGDGGASTDTDGDSDTDSSTSGSWVECAPDADEPSVFVFAETETNDYILVFYVEPVGEGDCQDLMLFFGPEENIRHYGVTQCVDGGSYIIGFEMDGSEAVLSYSLDVDTEGSEVATDVKFTYKGEEESAQILEYESYDTSSFEFYCIE